MRERRGSSGGVGFAGLLALLFIALKLTGVIDWGWWLVLMPLWLPLAVMVAVFLAFYIAGLVSERKRGR